ncbi:oxidoreductase [Streptomyces malaysiensis]|uniref:oxidoreductase n=1 Tax=Streptomyces malaysiensis TaxID=92644 RepID=UPI00321FA53B
MSDLTSVPGTQPLLQPVQLGALKLPNRVVMAPMTRCRADNEELAPTDLHATYYAQRAGAGLIIGEGAWVSTDAIGFINVPGIYTDAQTAGWAKVTEAVHSAGGMIVSQLGHAGAASHPDHHGGRLPAGPSAINPHEMSFTPDGPKDSLTPRALSAAEIATTIGTYRQAAVNALRAGFDGLEIHAQVSHLVAQFLNPRLNQRTDAYGSSSEKRAQFLFDVVDAVSSVWGSDRIGIKSPPTGITGLPSPQIPRRWPSTTSSSSASTTATWPTSTSSARNPTRELTTPSPHSPATAPTTTAPSSPTSASHKRAATRSSNGNWPTRSPSAPPSSPIQTSSIDSPTAALSPPTTATRTSRVARRDTRTTPQ